MMLKEDLDKYIENFEIKKVRYIQPYLNDWDVRSGPPIGQANDIYFLLQEPWFEVKQTSIAQCKEEGVVPWVRDGAREAIKEAERLEYPIIVGPSTVFGCSDHPEYNDYELKSPVVKVLLMNDYYNMRIARVYGASYPHRIKQVPFFMRPELYTDPMFYEYEWDVYFHIKGDVNLELRTKFPNHTATFHGWYKYKELKYKAQHSKVCVTSCHYENYGLAVHEINLLGCPIVYGPMSMKPGSVGEGMGVYCKNQNFQDLDEVVNAIKEAMNMDRNEVYKASMNFQSIVRCKEKYYNAFFGKDYDDVDMPDVYKQFSPWLTEGYFKK